MRPAKRDAKKCISLAAKQNLLDCKTSQSKIENTFFTSVFFERIYNEIHKNLWFCFAVLIYHISRWMSMKWMELLIFPGKKFVRMSRIMTYKYWWNIFWKRRRCHVERNESVISYSNEGNKYFNLTKTQAKGL